MIWFTGGDTPLFGQMGMCHSTGCGLQGLLTISLFKPGQTYCVKKIMYFRRQLSRSSAQQGEASGRLDHTLNHWHFQKIPTFWFGDSQYTRLQKSCCCCFFCFFFFSKSVFQGERRWREILARNERVFFRSLLTVSFCAFTHFPAFRLACSIVLDLCTNTGSFAV